jgi:hypothetical protein
MLRPTLTLSLLLSMVMVFILHADLITRQTLISCEVFKALESPYETDFMAYKS